jgi:SAM-dependent methyltransferase
MMTRHLDLGCGDVPKNPYSADEVYGVDIRPNLGANIISANLAIQSIPFTENYFDSVSAYDFLEHIPRLIVDLSSQTSFFPFIRLMDEIWRVLIPGGRLYAVTPAYPSHKSFVDPTHVNFISKKTHEYFTGEQPLARMYGFMGHFKVLRTARIRPRTLYEPKSLNTREKIDRWVDALSLRRSHMIWELSKTK